MVGERSYLAAAIQVCASSDRKENLDKAEDFVRLAALRGARLIVLPELFAWRGAREDEPAQSEPIPGPTSERMRHLAETLQVHLLAGSLLERSDERRAYNTSILFGPDGSELARYRKLHLFDIDLKGHVTVRESDTRRPGQDIVLAHTALGTVGLAICYDLRFPELFRALTRRGAEVIALPAAFTFPTGAAHWEILLRARAIENLVYVIAPDQIGGSASGIVDYGHSLIIDPWGTVLAQAPDTEGIILAEIDLDRQVRLRRELPCLDHIRLPVD